MMFDIATLVIGCIVWKTSGRQGGLSSTLNHLILLCFLLTVEEVEDD
jgi:hypothetical protein